MESLFAVVVCPGEIDSQGRQIFKDPHPQELPVPVSKHDAPRKKDPDFEEKQLEYEAKIAEYEAAKTEYDAIDASLTRFAAESMFVGQTGLTFPANIVKFDSHWLQGKRDAKLLPGGLIQIQHLGKLK